LPGDPQRTSHDWYEQHAESPRGSIKTLRGSGTVRVTGDVIVRLGGVLPGMNSEPLEWAPKSSNSNPA
jgi:hypothetical protein